MHRATPPVRSVDGAATDRAPRTGRQECEQEPAAALRRPSMKSLALRLLARREHSRRELERKLLRHAAADGAHPPQGDAGDATVVAQEEIQSALDDLAARGLLSDARVAEAVIVAKAGRFGGRRLQQELQAKGLAPELIEQTLQEARPGELERAREVWRRRFGVVAANPGERARQARFLAGRGFAADIVHRVIRGLDEPD